MFYIILAIGAIPFMDSCPRTLKRGSRSDLTLFHGVYRDSNPLESILTWVFTLLTNKTCDLPF